MVKRIFSVLTALALTAGLAVTAGAAEPVTYELWTSDFDGAAVDQKKDTIFGDVTAIGKTGETASNAGLKYCASSKTDTTTKVGADAATYALKLAKSASDNGYAFAVLNTTAELTADDIKLAENDEFNMSFEVYAGMRNNDNGQTTVSLIGDNSIAIASYTYDASSGNITDVKIGDNTADNFTVFQANSVSSDSKNCEAPNTFHINSDFNLQVEFSVKGNGDVSVTFKHDRKSIDKTYSGKIENGVSAITKFSINSQADDPARMYSIDTLETTITKAEAPAIAVTEGSPYYNTAGDGVFAKTYTFETPADAGASGVSVTVNDETQTKTIANINSAIKFGIIVVADESAKLENLSVSAELVQ